jgi:hypothetical protein
MNTQEALDIINRHPQLLKRIEEMAEAAILEATQESPTDMLSRDIDNAVYLPEEECFRVLHRTHREHMEIDFDKIAEHFLPRSEFVEPYRYRKVRYVVDLDW